MNVGSHGVAGPTRERRWRLAVSDDSTRPHELPVVAPATGEAIAMVPAANREDAATAVESARVAVDPWRRVTPRDRASVLRGVAAVISDNADELADLDTLGQGTPIVVAQSDVSIAAEAVAAVANSSLTLCGQTSTPAVGLLRQTFRQPLGVIVQMFGHHRQSLRTLATRIAAPMMAGNAVVVLPPENSPLPALRLSELLADVVPDGLLSVLSTSNRPVCEYLVADPDVDHIEYLGDPITSASLREAARSTRSTNLSVQLTGSRGWLALPDADHGSIASRVADALVADPMLPPAVGPTCSVFVHRAAAEGVLGDLCSAIGALAVGHPNDPTTQIGPFATRELLDDFATRIAASVDDGAVVAWAGPPGSRAAGASTGNFTDPVILTAVHPLMEVLCPEAPVGPLVALFTFDTVEEAAHLANSVPSWTAVSVMTPDTTEAYKLASTLQCSSVIVDASMSTDTGHYADALTLEADSAVYYTQRKEVAVDTRR